MPTIVLLHISSQDDFHEIFILGQPDKFYINSKATMMEVVTDMTSFLGRMPSPPDWVQGGAILGVQGGTARVGKREYKNKMEIVFYCVLIAIGILRDSFLKPLLYYELKA